MKGTRGFEFTGAALLVTIVAATAGTARAQDDGDEPGVYEDAPVETSASGGDLDRKIRALRWGVATSTVAIPLGAGLLFGGALACFGTEFLSTDRCTSGQIALQGIGIALMIAGTGGMIASAILLRRRKQERKGLRAARKLQWSYTKGAFVF